MGNKALRKRIESLRHRMHEHLAKIDTEKRKMSPDQGLIHHWEAEVAAFRSAIHRAEKRVKR